MPWTTLIRLISVPADIKTWISLMDKAEAIQDSILQRVIESRKKDYDNVFRKATFESMEEMEAVTGNIEKNSFIGMVA